ncbi:chemotaxis protein CheW [Novosphingobium sp.]|uniref:chemotaxis protein CheW n=1 Tax=Novosphingobium sp. TaxID=1874826 RepID=UPI0031CFB168
MLFLAFRIGGEAMALAAEHIVEIVPLVDLEQPRQGTQGVFQYRGQYIPAIDLSLRDTGHPARRRMSTRIVVIRSPWDEAQLVGLIAEGASAMLRFDPADFAPFAHGPDGLVQRVEPRDLVPQEVGA